MFGHAVCTDSAVITVSGTDGRHRVGSFELAAAARRLRGIDEETKLIDGCAIYVTIKEGRGHTHPSEYNTVQRSASRKRRSTILPRHARAIALT